MGMTGPGSGTVVINQSKCKKCGECYRICHANAIVLETDQYVVDPKRCLSCLMCDMKCSHGAIDVK